LVKTSHPEESSRWMTSPFSSKTLITVHPSSVLRAPDPAAKEKVTNFRRLLRSRIISICPSPSQL
jgi:hypothetical protein